MHHACVKAINKANDLVKKEEKNRCASDPTPPRGKKNVQITKEQNKLSMQAVENM